MLTARQEAARTAAETRRQRRQEQQQHDLGQHRRRVCILGALITSTGYQTLLSGLSLAQWHDDYDEWLQDHIDNLKNVIRQRLRNGTKASVIKALFEVGDLCTHFNGIKSEDILDDVLGEPEFFHLVTNVSEEELEEAQKAILAATEAVTQETSA